MGKMENGEAHFQPRISHPLTRWTLGGSHDTELKRGLKKNQAAAASAMFARRAVQCVQRGYCLWFTRSPIGQPLA